MSASQEDIFLPKNEVFDLALGFLLKYGLSEPQAKAMAKVLVKAQSDDCRSHGLQRLPGTRDTMAHPKFNANADPGPKEVPPPITRVEADFGFSFLRVGGGLPKLIANAKSPGIRILAVNNGFHFIARWPG